MFGSIHSITPFRRRLSFAAGGALALLALAGCSTTASVSTPVSSTTISSAVTAGYNELCVGSASSPSLLTVAGTVPLNAQRQADLTTLQQICANGVPTNALTVTVDGISAYAMLQRDFPSLGLK